MFKIVKHTFKNLAVLFVWPFLKIVHEGVNFKEQISYNNPLYYPSLNMFSPAGSKVTLYRWNI